VRCVMSLELLAPAGDLEKLKVGVMYGADAVYLGGENFGLRARAGNFTLEEIKEGVEFAHLRNAKVYVVLNSFLFDNEIQKLPEFVTYLEQMGVDAVIVSDMGVFQTVKSSCNIDIHVSTQASCLNESTVSLWKSLGAKRVILGREVSITEAKKIRQNCGIEVEMFSHGSLCMAYSGHCVISNYTGGRDSNRGGCAHSCRFEYSLDFKNNQKQSKKSFFMSSKDLNGIELVDQFEDASIDSLKIEGRMKTALYLATVVKSYRAAIDSLKTAEGPAPSPQELDHELRSFSHRDYTAGGLSGEFGSESVYDREHGLCGDYMIIGSIKNASAQSGLVLEVRNGLKLGDKIEIMTFKGKNIEIELDQMFDFADVPIESINPNQLLKIPYIEEVNTHNIVRKMGRLS
jgi:U32 family peptidase